MKQFKTFDEEWLSVIVAICLFIGGGVMGATIAWANREVPEVIQPEPESVTLTVAPGYDKCNVTLRIDLFTPEMAYNLGLWGAACKAKLDEHEEK